MNEDKFEWDFQKASLNLEKHGVDFADVVFIFEDEQALTMSDLEHEEDRFVTMGMDALGRVLVVVYTYRGENIRVISARKASPGEIKYYKGTRK